MRYIKLKNGIIDVYSKFGFNEKYCDEHEDKFEEEFAKYAINEHVIKRSNNIEELCDCFIKIKKEKNRNDYILKFDFRHLPELRKTKKKYPDSPIYGAINIDDKGLIYVAKMNNNGEFELL